MKLSLSFDPSRHSALFGRSGKNLKQIEHRLRVKIGAQGGNISVESDDDRLAKRAHDVMKTLVKRSESVRRLGPEDIDSIIDDVIKRESPFHLDHFRGSTVPYTDGQTKYISAMMSNDLCFCFGPAGSGKTYLAVAMAVSMLKSRQVARIVLVRPAVEAGEKLGFLPGDINEKLDPYMRPLYDALGDMMKPDMLKRLFEDGVVEIAPLAFMRGRTLHDAAVILDEAQNATQDQMLMFLTRMGKRCKMIVTGDVSQTDIDGHQPSGLADASKRLEGVEGIGVVELSRSDIVRHPLVESIVEAYGRGQTL